MEMVGRKYAGTNERRFQASYGLRRGRRSAWSGGEGSAQRADGRGTRRAAGHRPQLGRVIRGQRDGLQKVADDEHRREVEIP